MMPIVLYSQAAVALLFSWLVDTEKTRRALKINGKSLHGLGGFMLDVWVSRELVEAHLENDAGLLDVKVRQQIRQQVCNPKAADD